jgi:nicotinic acetylcholine receptor
VDLTDYEKSGTWDVVAVPGEITNLYDSKEKVNVSRATYKIVMRRKTLYYATNLILPCVLVSMLTMIVFYLPATAGEKVTFTISILLALIVFLQVLVTNLLPPSSISLPLFAKYLLFTIVIDVCSILNTIISLNWNWKTPRTDSMPSWLRTFFFKYLAKILMMERPESNAAGGPTEQTPNSTNSMTSAQRIAQVSRMYFSDSHNSHCRYSNMSSRQRERELASEQSSQLHVSNDLTKAVEAVRFIAAHLKNENDYEEVDYSCHHYN